METVEVVIKLPEEYYKAIMKIPVNQSTADMLIIKNGTVLPKGHGRLIDADDYLANTPIRKSADDTWIKETYVYDTIMDAPTIIDANKEGDTDD